MDSTPKTALFVGAVVMRDDEVLFVRQSPGHSLAGQWTIPWGRVDSGESPLEAAVREVREEAGVDAAVLGLLKEPWSEWLVRRVFSGSVTVTRGDSTNPLQARGAFL